ncbi:FkbM family methyltransferase [Massilia niastensis]|uniref:FkbM family methyltransferase n=1 Tax=Massilia niastensis TaxID=544911 RepID=UPI00037AF39A|nr:FkbM family methyltransferase [Massilia niastensis]
MNYFVSYAQNNEDVLLWRALGHVENGFYIDVGANDPVEHSVTKAFYERGWRGISIEPLPSFHQAFLEQRPRDINLAIAAGASEGELTLYDVPSVRGWASPEAAVADMHRAEGYDVAELKVPVKTLASVCEEHVGGEIHFLKIDVEGFEGEVLRGMDFRRWRPWVLVIEATLPNSRETNHAAWEPMVTGSGYRYAWFDGLNRYYVAEEHAELLAKLDIQPNVFDGYISHHLDKAWAANHAVQEELKHLHELQEQLDRANDRVEQAARDRMHADARIAALAETVALEQANAEKLLAWARSMEANLIAVHGSTSWKITHPLRLAGRLVHALRRPQRLRRIVTRLTRTEALRRLLIPILLRFPALNRRVAASLAAIKQDPPAPLPEGVPAVPDELRGLPASVRAVLADLQRARSIHTGS